MPQKKYVPGEEVIFEIRPSWFILAFQELPMIIAVAGILVIFAFTGLYNLILYLVVLLAGLFVVFVIFLNWYFTIFRMTNKRVENQVGIFGRREEEIALKDIETVDFERTFWGKFFNFGTVLIKAAGEGREVDFTNITDAKRVADQIEDMAISAREAPDGE